MLRKSVENNFCPVWMRLMYQIKWAVDNNHLHVNTLHDSPQQCKNLSLETNVISIFIMSEYTVLKKLSYLMPFDVILLSEHLRYSILLEIVFLLN